MKKISTLFLSLTICAAIFSGCASYRATPLETPSMSMIQTASTSCEDNLVITAKAFNSVDCKRFLDRDVIAKGYQPIQLYIQNDTDSNYHFSLERVSLPCARPEQVAQEVHTSTIGRAAGYGVAALFLTPIFVIPAIVDGVKSSQANDQLDQDFSAKTAKDQLIFSKSRMNKVIFVPTSDYQRVFTISLYDQKDEKMKTFNIPVLD